MEVYKKIKAIRIIIILILMVLSISIYTVFNNKLSGDFVFLKIIEKFENDVLIGAGYYPYIDALTKANIKKSDGDYTLAINIDAGESEQYNGFGFDTNLNVPKDAAFEMDVYNDGPSVKVYINITDGSAQGGEVFAHSKILRNNSWNYIKIPLSEFSRNNWQPEGASTDGKFDTKGIRQIALSVKPYTSLQLELRSVRFTWGIPGYVIISFLLCALITGILLIAKTNTIYREIKVTSNCYTQRMITRFVFIGIIFVSSFFFQQKLLQSDYLVYIMYLVLLLIVFLDEFIILPKRISSYWAYRYLVLVLVFVYFRSQSNAWLPLIALLVIIAHGPFLSVSNSKLMFFTIIPTLLVIILSPPIFEIKTKIISTLLVLSGTLLSYFAINVIRSKEDRLEADRRNQLFNGIFEYSSDAIILTDRDGIILSVNRGFYKMIGIESHKVTGESFYNYVGGESKATIVLKQGQFDILLKDREENLHTVLLRVQPLYQKNVVKEYIVIATDITERKQMEEELQRLSIEDGLTGLYNRRFFDDTMVEEWQRARRNKSMLSILIIDVDYFKKYNDTYGHQKGDEALIKTADVIKMSLKRSTDRAARYGGEEFIVTLPETSGDNLHILAESIRAAVEDLRIKHKASEVSDFLTISMGGVTIIPDDDLNIDNFIKKADDALYEAKEKGRNRFILHSFID